MEPTNISVLIVGAGVAGLTAALEFKRQGHDVRIIERAPSRLLSGDDFTIGSSVIRALRHYPGMIEENERISWHPWVSWHDINGQKYSGPAPLFDKGTQSDTNADAPQVYRHSRPKFHDMLATRAAKSGVRVEYGFRAVEYYESPTTDKAGIVLDNGEKIEADIVVAADGIGSKSSKATIGGLVPARSTGFAIYRAAFPVEIAYTDPELKERFKPLDDGTPVMELWAGEGLRATFGSSADHMSWTINYPDNGTETDSWSKLVDPEVVLDKVAGVPGWPDFANRLIKLTPKERLHDFKLLWREPQPSWVSPSGRIVQIGDAAHSFLPSSGNGATQGIEDALSLATCLRLGGKQSVALSTKVHNKLRFERVACLQLLGILNQESRNQSVGEDKPKISKPIGLTAPWIWRHDPEDYAITNYEKAKECVENGTKFQNNNIPVGYTYKPWTIDEVLEKVSKGEFHLEGDWE